MEHLVGWFAQDEMRGRYLCSERQAEPTRLQEGKLNCSTPNQRREPVALDEGVSPRKTLRIGSTDDKVALPGYGTSTAAFHLVRTEVGVDVLSEAANRFFYTLMFSGFQSPDLKLYTRRESWRGRSHLG